MTTHVENKQAGTLITGSTVAIDTLTDSTVTIDTINVNKTSTEEQILNLLPIYHDINSLDHEDYVFDLASPLNVDLTQLFKVFINGALIPIAQTLNSDGVYLYASNNQFQINGAAYRELVDQPGTLIHALYTPA